MPELKVETFYTTDYSFYGDVLRKSFIMMKMDTEEKYATDFFFLVSTCKKTLKVKEN